MRLFCSICPNWIFHFIWVTHICSHDWLGSIKPEAKCNAKSILCVCCTMWNPPEFVESILESHSSSDLWRISNDDAAAQWPPWSDSLNVKHLYILYIYNIHIPSTKQLLTLTRFRAEKFTSPKPLMIERFISLLIPRIDSYFACSTIYSRRNPIKKFVFD